MREGPGLVRLRRHLVEDQAPGLVHADTALDQVLGEAAFEVQTAGQIVDGGDAIALGLAGAGGDGLGVGCRSGVRHARGGRFGLLAGFGLGGDIPGHGGRALRHGCLLLHAGVDDLDGIAGLVGGADLRAGIGGNGHEADLERGPALDDALLDLALRGRFDHLHPLDGIADRDVADDAVADQAEHPVCGLVEPLAGETDGGLALLALDPGAFDDAHLRMRGPNRMAVERRGPGVEARQVHRAVADLEDLVEGHGGVPAGPAPPPNGRAGGKHHVDRARLGVDSRGQDGRAPQLHWQGDRGRHDRVGHGPIPSLVRMRGRPGHWSGRPPARCRSW